jgi:hypothetical protein
MEVLAPGGITADQYRLKVSSRADPWSGSGRSTIWWEIRRGGKSHLKKFTLLSILILDFKVRCRMEAISLTVDSKNRISLTKLLPDAKISSVRAYKEDDRIILEPMVEIPAREIWLYRNKTALKKVRKGLSQKGTVRRGSFADHAK